MVADLHIVLSKFGRLRFHPFTAFRVFDPEEFFGQELAKVPVGLQDAVKGCCPACEPAVVDPLLDCYMR